MSAYLPASLRDDFPLLAREHAPGRPLIYLDSAATALRSRRVIEAVTAVMERHTANVHRAVHVLGDEATEVHEGARARAARLIGAEPHEIIFVRNTTEALNVVARGWPRQGRVLTTLGEHHSNLLPWVGEVTRVPPRPDGLPDEEGLLRELARGGVSLVAAAHVSNVVGGRLDAARLAAASHAAGAVFVLDAAQSVPHVPLDVHELGCDFLAFSGHKLGAPGGVGVLWGRADRLLGMSPSLLGGGTVEEVAGGVPLFRQPPWRFEAGTPALEAIAGLGAAVDYLREIGLEEIDAHGRALYALARERLAAVPGVRVVGPVSPAQGQAGPLSFVCEGTPSHLIARALSDRQGICVRSGFQCAQPLHEHLGRPPSLRVSFWVYNQPWEIDRFVEALAEVLAHAGRPR